MLVNLRLARGDGIRSCFSCYVRQLVSFCIHGVLEVHSSDCASVAPSFRAVTQRGIVLSFLKTNPLSPSSCLPKHLYSYLPFCLLPWLNP